MWELRCYKSQQDSPETKTPTQMTKSISVSMSREEFQAMRERDPYGSLEIAFNLLFEG